MPFSDNNNGTIMENKNSLKDPYLYINRELSWLRFNTRVLEEAENVRHPLLERLKFIAIYGTNLDEFYMIRAAGLQEMYKMGINAVGADKMTPIDQLGMIRDYLHKEKLRVGNCYADITDSLKKEGLFIKKYHELSPELQARADAHFFSNLYPVIIPIAIDATHPFPHLNNLSFALAVKLVDKEDKHNFRFGLIRIPRVLSRFVELENSVFVSIESIVRRHIENLFLGYECVESIAFKVTRNADLVIEEEEAEDFLELLEQGIRARRKGEFVRLTLEESSDDELNNFLMSHIKLDEGDIYRISSLPLDLSALWQIVGAKRFAHLTYKPYTPKVLPPLDLNTNIFDQIEKGDILFYQPYESFDPVVKFIVDASKDHDVLSIKMTLYRVGKNSPLVKALIEAAENGIQVTALVELKARFDEENNLHWARALERAGAHVVYGIAGLKVHAKIATVVRKHRDGLKQYMHLSTGNYNVQSARIYTDIGFFTANKDMAEDATKFFHHLTGSAKYSELHALSMAPTQMKKTILSLIENEEKCGADGQIIAKMNALVDADVIRALYGASQAGAKISLIIRGICCLRPGVAGISENIRVTSIVGKYLEHARMFYFKNSSPQMYFSSADWMTRNLEKRIELLTPVFDAKISQKLLEILRLQVDDDVQARVLGVDGEYARLESQNGGLDSQKILEDYVTGVFESHAKEQNSKENRLASKLLKES